MSSFPKEMKPEGYTVKRQEGDWLTTYEVVGWNSKAQVNVWAEKGRKWNPRPDYSQAVAAMERDRDYEYTRMVNKKMKGL